MMRSPYQSPKDAPAQRFLRRRPTAERAGRRRALLIGVGAAVAWLSYVFIGSDTGLLRIAALRHEIATLNEQKLELSTRVNDLERLRKEQARDPNLEERVARERFHLMKKDEILYRYDEPAEDAKP
jgi:cell division protein FtsB